MMNKYIFNIWTVLILTVLAFSPIIHNQWLNDFDEDDLTDDVNVEQYRPNDIFLKSTTDTYVPLTSLSFAVEYHFFKNKSLPYRVNNVILHLLITYLIYLFVIRIGSTAISISKPSSEFPDNELWSVKGVYFIRKRTAVLTALIFAIHPMHVESVAWLAERKDVLYSVFYLMGLILYLDKKYLFCFIACVLAILSKPMALSFPLILLLLDWWQGRKLSWQMIVEKIPFFIAVALISFITFINIDKVNNFNLSKAWLYWISSCMFYPAKFLWATNFSPIYSYVPNVNINNQFYIFNVVAFFMFVASMIVFRKNKIYMFACGYYLLSSFFLFRMNYQDYHWVADRFFYLPSLGLCVFIAFWIERAFKYKITKVFLTGLIVYLFLMTFTQVQVWKKSKTMWAKVVKENKNIPRFYEEQAENYREKEDYYKATQYWTRAIHTDLENPKLYNERAWDYMQLNQINKASSDFITVLNMYLYNDWVVDDDYKYAERELKRLYEIDKHNKRVENVRSILKKDGLNSYSFNLWEKTVNEQWNYYMNARTMVITIINQNNARKSQDLYQNIQRSNK